MTLCRLWTSYDLLSCVPFGFAENHLMILNLGAPTQLLSVLSEPTCSVTAVGGGRLVGSVISFAQAFQGEA